MATCFIYSDLEHGNFLNTDILQGSVVTQLTCGGDSLIPILLQIY